MEGLFDELGIPKKYLKPTGRDDRFIALVHKNWLKTLLKHSKLPDFVEKCKAETWPYAKDDLEDSWSKIFVRVFKKREAKVIPLPCVRKNAHEDHPLLIPQLMEYIHQTNYKNLWKEASRKYATSDASKTKQVTLVDYNEVLREIIVRVYGCSIVNTYDGELSVENVRDFEVHQNIYPCLAGVETLNAIFLIHSPFIEHNLQDCVTFSPSILEKCYTKPLFLIYQILNALKALHERSLTLGEITLADVYLTDDLWVYVFPQLSSNIHVQELQKGESAHDCRKGGHRFDANLSCLNCGARGYDKVQVGGESLEKLCDLWVNGRISNYTYLMALNNLSGRRFGDPNCHYVFPWVTDFASRCGKNWRDLKKSKFRLNKGDRQLDLTYENPQTQIPHHVSDVLSSITYYVYMSRRTPKSVLCKNVRTVWVPAEYPSSIQRLQEWTPDECIPEFFSDPTVFHSIHDDLDDLEVPGWCSGPEDFVDKHREALESQHVSERLHLWIDLTFGYRLAGHAAVRSKNVCLQLVDGHTNLTTSGVVQLFMHPHPPKATNLPFWGKIPPKVYVQTGKQKRDHSSSSATVSIESCSRSEEEDEELSARSPLSKLHSRSRSSLNEDSKDKPGKNVQAQQRSTSLGPKNASFTSHIATKKPSNNLNTGLITLPKEFQPAQALVNLENLHGFFAKTFHTAEGKLYKGEKSCVEREERAPDFIQHAFTNKLFESQIKTRATKSFTFPIDNQNILPFRTKSKLPSEKTKLENQVSCNYGEIVVARRVKELQVLGCLIAEIFMAKQLRVLQMANQNKHHQTHYSCKTGKSYKYESPLKYETFGKHESSYVSGKHEHKAEESEGKQEPFSELHKADVPSRSAFCANETEMDKSTSSCFSNRMEDSSSSGVSSSSNKTDNSSKRAENTVKPDAEESAAEAIKYVPLTSKVAYSQAKTAGFCAFNAHEHFASKAHVHASSSGFCSGRSRGGFVAPNRQSLMTRVKTCLTILTSCSHEIPSCVRNVVHLLLQPENKDLDAFKYPAVTDLGLPPPTAHMLLEPLLHQLLPFNENFYTLYALISNLKGFERVSEELDVFYHFDCDGERCLEYENVERTKILLAQNISECKVRACARDLEELFEDISTVKDGEIIALLVPHIKRLIEEPPTSILAAWYLFDPVAKFLGPVKTGECLLTPILKLYETDSNAPHFVKIVKLYHHSFLLRLIVRFGLRKFLEHFSTPLVEAVGGYRDQHFSEESFLHTHAAKNLARKTSNLRNIDDVSHEKVDLSPGGDDSSGSERAERRVEEVFDFEQLDAEEQPLQSLIEHLELNISADLPFNHSSAEEALDVVNLEQELMLNLDEIETQSAGVGLTSPNIPIPCAFKQISCDVGSKRNEDAKAEEKCPVCDVKGRKSEGKCPICDGNKRAFLTKFSSGKPEDACEIGKTEGVCEDAFCEICGVKLDDISPPNETTRRLCRLCCSDDDFAKTIPIPKTLIDECDKPKYGKSLDDDVKSSSSSSFTKLRRNEAKISSMGADSLIWLSHRLGPVLTARYLSRNLLKMLTLCYVGRENLIVHSDASLVDTMDLISIANSRVIGDKNAAKVLECLASIAALYGEQLILLQYLPHMSELIALCKRKLTPNLEGGLISCLALLKHIIPYICDSTLMDQLQDVILKNILHPSIRLLGSTKYAFPNGSMARNVLARKYLDTLYVLSLRMGADMTRTHLAVPALQRFFLIFDKISENSAYFTTSTINEQRHESQSKENLLRSIEESHFLEVRRDGTIAEWAIGGRPVQISHVRLKDSDSTDSLSPPKLPNSQNSASGGEESVGNQALEELQAVFTPELAHTAYIPFLKQIGQQSLESSLKNHANISNLCQEYEKELKQTITSINNQMTDLLEQQKLNASSSVNTSSIGSNVAVIGNRIDVQEDQDLKNTDILSYISNKMENNVRHLRGNWLAYWEHEIGRSDKDVMFNFKQIKLQTFVGHSQSIKSLHVLDNENSFLSGSRDKTVKLWSLRSLGDGTGVSNCQSTYTSHKKSVLAIAFLDGLRLVASCDSVVHLWDPFMGASVGVLESPKNAPVNVLKSQRAPSSLLFAATTEGTLRVIDARMCSYVHELKVTISPTVLIRCLAVSPSGNWIATGQASGQITVLDTRTGLVMASWRAHEGELLQIVAFNEDTIISSSFDQTISVWNVNDGKFKFHMNVSLNRGGSEPVHCLNLYNNELISGSTANRIGVHTSVDGDASFSTTKLRSDTFKGLLSSMAVLPLNRLLLLGADTGNIHLLC